MKKKEQKQEEKQKKTKNIKTVGFFLGVWFVCGEKTKKKQKIFRQRVGE